MATVPKDDNPTTFSVKLTLPNHEDVKNEHLREAFRNSKSSKRMQMVLPEFERQEVGFMLIGFQEVIKSALAGLIPFTAFPVAYPYQVHVFAA